MLTKDENERIRRAYAVLCSACEILPSVWCYDTDGQLKCHCCPISKACEQLAMGILPSATYDNQHIPE